MPLSGYEIILLQLLYFDDMILTCYKNVTRIIARLILRKYLDQTTFMKYLDI